MASLLQVTGITVSSVQLFSWVTFNSWRLFCYAADRVTENPKDLTSQVWSGISFYGLCKFWALQDKTLDESVIVSSLFCDVWSKLRWSYNEVVSVNSVSIDRITEWKSRKTHWLVLALYKTAWNKIFICINSLNGPKITVEEICNKTFAYCYFGIRSIERTK